ncbi:MAG: hypothetical protein ACRDT6_12855 [Micromonosporaceae bacterium]
MVRQLTPAQLALGKQVFAKARTLNDRVNELRDRAWNGANIADVNAVRGWLFDVHRDDDESKTARDRWAELVAGAE